MNKKKPTEKQKDVLAVIKRFRAEHGYSPTITEIAQAVNRHYAPTLTSINCLQKLGIIKRMPRIARSIKVIKNEA